MTIQLTKAWLRAELGSDAATARFFGISSAAVAQWPEDAPIPELRQLQAERKRPEWFREGGAAAQRPGAANTDEGDAAQANGTSVATVSEAA